MHLYQDFSLTNSGHVLSHILLPFLNFLTVTSAPFITGGAVLNLPVNLGREKLCDNLLGLKSSSLFKGTLMDNVSPWRIQKRSYCSQ